MSPHHHNPSRWLWFCFIWAMERTTAQQQTILVASSPFRMNLFPTDVPLPSTSLRIIQQVALESVQATLLSSYSQGKNNNSYYYMSEKTKLIFPEEEIYLAQNRSTSIPFFALATAANVTFFPPGTALEELRIQAANQRRNDLDQAIQLALGSISKDDMDDNDPDFFLENLFAKSDNTALQNVTTVTIESLSSGNTVDLPVSNGNNSQTNSQGNVNNNEAKKSLSVLDVALISVSLAIFIGISFFLIQCLRERRASVHNLTMYPHEDNGSGDTIPVSNPSHNQIKSGLSKKQNSDMASIFHDEETPRTRPIMDMSFGSKINDNKSIHEQFHSIDGFRANMLHDIQGTANVTTAKTRDDEFMQTGTSMERMTPDSNSVSEEEKTEIEHPSLDDHFPKHSSSPSIMRTDHLMDLVSIGTPELVNEDSEIFLFTDQLNSYSEGEMLPPEPPRRRMRYTTSNARSDDMEHYSESSSEASSSTRTEGNKRSIFRHESLVSASHDGIPFITMEKLVSGAFTDADAGGSASEHKGMAKVHCATEAATRKKTASTEPASSSASASKSSSSSSSSSELSISATSTISSSSLTSTTTAFSTCDETKEVIYSASTSAAEVEPIVATNSVLNGLTDEVAGLLKAVLNGQADEASEVLKQMILPNTLDATKSAGLDQSDDMICGTATHENLSPNLDQGTVDNTAETENKRDFVSRPFSETFESNVFRSSLSDSDLNALEVIVHGSERENSSAPSRQSKGNNEDVFNVEVDSGSSKRKNKNAPPVAIAEWMKSIRVVSSCSGGTGSKTSTTGSDVSSLTPSLGVCSYEQSMASSLEAKRNMHQNMNDSANQSVEKAEV